MNLIILTLAPDESDFGDDNDDSGDDIGTLFQILCLIIYFFKKFLPYIMFVNYTIKCVIYFVIYCETERV